MKRNDPILSVQVPSEIRDTLDSCSRMEYTTRSQIVRKVLGEWYMKLDKDTVDNTPPMFGYSG